MLLGLFAIGEDTGGLDNDVDTEFFPRQLCWVALGEYLDALAVYDNVVSVDRNSSAQATGYRVVLQKVCKPCGVREVIYGNNF